MLQRHGPKGEEERACLALQEDNVLEAKVAAIAEIHCMLNVCLWCPRVTATAQGLLPMPTDLSPHSFPPGLGQILNWRFFLDADLCQERVSAGASHLAPFVLSLIIYNANCHCIQF